MTERLITQAKTAEMLGVSARTVARYRASGQLAAHRDELGRPYYSLAEVETMLAMLTSRRVSGAT